MHDSDDHCDIIYNPKIDAEWKPMDEGSPGVSMDHGIHQGVGFNIGDSPQYIIKKFMTQALPLLLIPNSSI